MIKLFNIFTKKAGMSTEDFKSYYEKNHAPLAVSLFPYFADYRRNFVNVERMRLSHLPDAAPQPDFDCITIAWFEDQANYDKVLQAFQNPEVANRIATDEANFFDRTRMILFRTEEHVSPVKDLGAAAEGAPEDGSMVKMFSMPRRKPGMSREAFKEYYETRHVPLVQKHMKMIAGYRRSYMMTDNAFTPGHIANQPPAPNVDVITELWFRTPADYAALNTAVSDPKIAKIFADDEANFLDRGSMMNFMVDERVSPKADIMASRKVLQG